MISLLPANLRNSIDRRNGGIFTPAANPVNLGNESDEFRQFNTSLFSTN
jgi:hypothetical protein